MSLKALEIQASGNRAWPFLENRSEGMAYVFVVSSEAYIKLGWSNAIPRAWGSQWTWNEAKAEHKWVAVRAVIK